MNPIMIETDDYFQSTIFLLIKLILLISSYSFHKEEDNFITRCLYIFKGLASCHFFKSIFDSNNIEPMRCPCQAWVGTDIGNFSACVTQKVKRIHFRVS